MDLTSIKQVKRLRRLTSRKLPAHKSELKGVIGRLGDLEVRLAKTFYELRATQKLRYSVFYEEMSAKADKQTAAKKRDADKYDPISDHLLVIDTSLEGSIDDQIVGTYRLLRQNVAKDHDGFYTQGEFDVAPMIAGHEASNFLELGRSCVLKLYRNKRTVELLWHGIWAYVLHHKIDVMFGCASFEGTEPSELAAPLHLLKEVAAPPKEWAVMTGVNDSIDLADLPNPLLDNAAEKKRALSALPPLIKGYLRLGAYIAEGAVIDRQFGTTDVLIVLPVENINPRYINHYGEDAGRYAA